MKRIWVYVKVSILKSKDKWVSPEVTRVFDESLYDRPCERKGCFGKYPKKKSSYVGKEMGRVNLKTHTIKTPQLLLCNLDFHFQVYFSDVVLKKKWTLQLDPQETPFQKPQTKTIL